MSDLVGYIIGCIAFASGMYFGFKHDWTNMSLLIIVGLLIIII